MSERSWTWSDNSDDPSGFMPYQSTSDWLSEILRMAVADSTVRDVLRNGADVDVAVALRLKSLRQSCRAPSTILPAAPHPSLIDQLCVLAESRPRLLSSNSGDKAAARQAIESAVDGVGAALVRYAAMELLDSRVLSSVRSLDVMCRPDDLLPAPVLLKLALGRADGIERSGADKEHKVSAPAWEAVGHAWDREMAHARATGKRWADLVVQGRMALGATEAVFL